MGQLKRFIAQVLGFEGWQVVDWYWETPDGIRFCPISPFFGRRDARLRFVVRRRWMGRCSDCGRRCRKVQEHTKTRLWRDLPWCGHSVQIECAPDRLCCPHCRRACVELLPWADRYQRETRRLQQHVALEAQSMPTSHVAVHYGLGWHTVRRAEREALERWLATREPVPLCMVGIDEKYLGRRHSFEDKYVTIVSNLETGEPLWIGFGRRQATVEAWLATLSAEDKAAVDLFAMDMHGPFMQAIRDDEQLRHTATVHDPFHIIKRANDALDELRRETYFRAGPELRALGRGKRWLYLRAWERCTADQQAELGRLLAGNGKLARARQVVDELRGVLQAPDRLTMSIGLNHVLTRTAKRANVPMRKLHDSLCNHYLEIVALGEHHPPTGRIEALNNNWETLLRQARGYRDLGYLLLKLRFATVNPIRTEDGVRRFLALGLPAPYRKAA
ncbi:ISL3 family transposase [Patescibacteria group bacterium]|nr:ISL3 family transposase [Patescibacteria group bacterium]